MLFFASYVSSIFKDNFPSKNDKDISLHIKDKQSIAQLSTTDCLHHDLRFVESYTGTTSLIHFGLKLCHSKSRNTFRLRIGLSAFNNFTFISGRIFVFVCIITRKLPYRIMESQSQNLYYCT